MSGPQTPADLPHSLVLVGAGKMGGALLQGWLASGMPGASVTVVDPNPSAILTDLCGRTGAALNREDAASRPYRVVVLAVKPQMLDTATPLLGRLVDAGTLLISIVAGKTISDLAARLPVSCPVIRAMPNTPAAVGRGMTGLFAGTGATGKDRRLAETLLAVVGRVEWVDDERLIDAVTAVSGSGPAYVFHLVECLAEAGAALGLPPDVAMRLARGTVEGAGELLFRSPDVTAASLRQSVTSPAGTTAAALQVLTNGDALRRLMTEAVAAANRRARELSG